MPKARLLYADRVYFPIFPLALKGASDSTPVSRSTVCAPSLRSPAVPAGKFARGILRSVAVGGNILRPFQVRHVRSQSADTSAFAWFVVRHHSSCIHR